MINILIIGNSIAADIMYAYLDQDPRYTVVAFAADKQYVLKERKFDVPVVAIESLTQRYSPDEHKTILAIGYSRQNSLRSEMFERVKALGYEIETYIHPDAKVYTKNPLGEGCIIMANAVLEVYTSIGKNSVVWANCVIGHHSIIGDNCWIASGTVLAGEANVGNNCFLGVNVTVSNKVAVAPFNIIGGHAAIHKNTRENEVYLSGQGEKHRFSARDYSTHILK